MMKINHECDNKIRTTLKLHQRTFQKTQQHDTTQLVKFIYEHSNHKEKREQIQKKRQHNMSINYVQFSYASAGAYDIS